MKDMFCPYFIICLIFGGLSAVFWILILPFLCFLGIHLYTKHIKEKLIEHQKLTLLQNRIDTLERRVSFSNTGR